MYNVYKLFCSVSKLNEIDMYFPCIYVQLTIILMIYNNITLCRRLQ